MWILGFLTYMQLFSPLGLYLQIEKSITTKWSTETSNCNKRSSREQINNFVHTKRYYGINGVLKPVAETMVLSFNGMLFRRQRMGGEALNMHSQTLEDIPVLKIVLA